MQYPQVSNSDQLWMKVIFICVTEHKFIRIFCAICKKTYITSPIFNVCYQYFKGYLLRLATQCKLTFASSV